MRTTASNQSTDSPWKDANRDTGDSLDMPEARADRTDEAMSDTDPAPEAKRDPFERFDDILLTVIGIGSLAYLTMLIVNACSILHSGHG